MRFLFLSLWTIGLVLCGFTSMAQGASSPGLTADYRLIAPAAERGLEPLPRRLSALEPCEYDPDECKYTATFLTVMGGAALLAGVGGLTGGILLSRNNQPLEGDSTLEEERKEGVRATARQVTVIGALAATVGTGLLLGGIAEWTRWRKYRPRVQRQPVHLAIWAGPRTGGATITARF